MRHLWKLSLVSLVIALPVAAIGVGWIGSNSTGIAPEGMRPELAQGILERWAPHVEATYGAKSSGWAERMRGTLEGADIMNLERAASAESFQQMNTMLLGIRSIQSKMPTALGTAGSDLVYTPLTPCRIVDTRVVGGPIPANGVRSFSGFTATDFTAQGGAASNCGIPLDVSALTVKITSEFPSGNGYFTVWPTNEAMPLASALNYSVGLILSNESHFKLCRPACPSDFSVYSYAQSTLVIDVTGYFVEPEATALDCTVAEATGNLALLPTLQTVGVDCPAGYTATGGGCGGALGITVAQSGPKSNLGQPSGWQCDMLGSVLSVLGYKVDAVCCRTPGR